MIVALPIIVLLAVTAGALYYTSRARREAAETAAELDRLMKQNRPPEPGHEPGQEPTQNPAQEP